MALKPDRVEHLTDLSFFMDETATRGQIVTHSSDGSGASMDDANAKVIVATGVDNPAGLLLNDVVDIDLTRQHINFAKDEVQKGGKVLLLRRGTVVTDNIDGATPSAGDKAYFDTQARLTTTASSAQIGRFLSAKDADGYAKVEINIV